MKILRSFSWFFMLLAITKINVGMAQDAAPKIVFLHLKLESNQVSLIDASVASGTLKKAPAADSHDHLDVEVATSTGQVLWTNTVPSPSIRHLEYEDPSQPGKIISRNVQLTNTEFTLRVPSFQNAHHVSFYVRSPAFATNAASTNQSSLTVTTPARTLAGTVTLPQGVK